MSQQKLVNLGGADRPSVVERIGIIGAIEILGRFVGAAVQRLVFEESEVHSAKPNALILGQVQINRKGIFALVLRMTGREKPVLVAVDRCREIWRWPLVQYPEAVLAGGTLSRGRPGRGE